MPCPVLLGSLECHPLRNLLKNRQEAEKLAAIVHGFTIGSDRSLYWRIVEEGACSTTAADLGD